MAQDLAVFHFEEDRPSFETYARENGFRYWLASELMVFLDYSSMTPIRNAINRAMSACAQLNISIAENFQETKTETGARDWKLSRFACYLTVMNGDPKKHQVAAAQAYFVTMAEAFRQFVQQAEDVERVVIRGEVSEREKAISGTVHARGVENFAFFQNAGYRGLYNLDLAQIRRKKGRADWPLPARLHGENGTRRKSVPDHADRGTDSERGHFRTATARTRGGNRR
jgi:DNA-damage-inducible protein D